MPKLSMPLSLCKPNLQCLFVPFYDSALAELYLILASYRIPKAMPGAIALASIQAKRITSLLNKAIVQFQSTEPLQLKFCNKEAKTLFGTFRIDNNSAYFRSTKLKLTQRQRNFGILSLCENIYINHIYDVIDHVYGASINSFEQHFRENPKVRRDIEKLKYILVKESQKHLNRKLKTAQYDKIT